MNPETTTSFHHGELPGHLPQHERGAIKFELEIGDWALVTSSNLS